MHLSKHLYKKLFLFFSICTLLLIVSNRAHSHTIISDTGLANINQPVIFTSTFTFLTGAGAKVSVNVYIDYGDGTPEETLGTAVVLGRIPTITFTSTHVYSKKGTYHVRIRSTSGGQVPAIPQPPNPAYITQKVSGLEISQIQLYFENNRPEITLNRNQNPPGLFVKINFSGSGYFKGYWEIDGKRRGYVFKFLSKGPLVIFKYPDIPPMPTFNYGIHTVRFIITKPGLDINFPHAIYFVTSDEKNKFATIKLIQPVEEKVAYKSLIFKWKPVTQASLYLLSIFSKTKKERVYAAYTKESAYKLKSNSLKTRMESGEKYIWNVVGFNDKNKITAESSPSGFTFNQAVVFLPGEILFITRQTEQGEKLVREVKDKYGFQILQTYSIKSLELTVTKFYTDKDISGIINELTLKKGVVAAQPNYIFKTMAEPLDDEPMNELQSIRKIIKIDPDIPFKGKGIALAVVDTGVDFQHRDLAEAVFFKANCLPGSKYKPEIHGTAVAGLIGARKNNFGIDGFAPESKIFALRACKQISTTQPQGECYSLSIAEALDIAIEHKVQIINMSLGTNVEDKLISKLIDKGSSQGIIFVAPAGNSSAAEELFFPASHPKVISVAGIKENKEFFPNSAVAEKADFYLPCENLFSTTPGNQHNFLSGTSLSSAVVSGLLALTYEKNRDMISKRVELFDGDINKWINEDLTSRAIVTKKK